MMNMKKLLVLLLLAAVLLGGIWYFSQQEFYDPNSPAVQKILAYAQTHGLSLSDYPQSLIDLLDRNPEAEQFVLEYPTAHKQTAAIDLSEYLSTETVPLFLQWDQRWGYQRYGSDVAGITGCGPVCLSMAGYYLTKNDDFSPDKMLVFAEENGYYVKGSGSSWTLISEGGPKLGLNVQELPLDENRIRQALESGSPVICVMGPGDFTTSGHYIVLTGLGDGGFRVNDPNSRKNSQKLWSYEQISGQIRNLWSISVK